MLDHKPIVLNTFKGHFDRGEDYVCPPDHFLDTLNIRYKRNGVESREGCTQNITKANIRRIHLYKRIGEVSRLLILDSSGNIYDSTDLINPVLTVAGMTDFSFVNFNNRAYISPHDGNKGLPGEKVYVYSGTGAARAAAGSKPSGTLSAVDSATAGSVEAGTHIFAVVYETDSGHYTVPGPATFATVSAAGGFKVDLSGIPTGPSGTSKRHIIATQSIATYDGNQYGYEFFFVPNGTLPNNTGTTLTVDFYDADLIDSADYLFDLKETIPAGIALSQYSGRLCVGGTDTDPSVVWISRRNEPESFDSTEGYVLADPTEAGPVRSCIEYRNSLYIFKSLRSYVTQDDRTNEPAYWEVVTIDKGAGTEVFGVSTILDAKGTSTDRFVIADRSGLILFDGYFNKPELSWKIQDIWKRITKTAFSKVQVLNDPVNQSLYVLVPLDGATSPSHVLYADYSEGLSLDTARWAVWSFPFAPVSAVIDVDTNSNPILRIAGYAGNVYNFASGNTSDAGTAISPQFTTALLPDEAGGIVHHYGAIRMRIKGSGFLKQTLSGLDSFNPTILPYYTLGSGPQQLVTRWINFINERMKIKTELESINETFSINELTIYYKSQWLNRVV